MAACFGTEQTGPAVSVRANDGTVHADEDE